MPRPISIAAVDAGSNGIRAAVATAVDAKTVHKLETERVAVRLGASVFQTGSFREKTIDAAVEAFKHFDKLFKQFDVKHYRAVGTAALRAASNRDALLSRLHKECDITVDVIDGEEEAALVRQAVIDALGPKVAPRLIFDLGGGSLEVCILDGYKVDFSASLNIGTVRLLEQFGGDHAMTSTQVATIRQYLEAEFLSELPKGMDLSDEIVVGCCGNARALARLAPSERRLGRHEALDVYRLHDLVWPVAERDTDQRMAMLKVRRDRAEVIAVASVVLSVIGRWFNAPHMITPNVGVRDALLANVAQDCYGSTPLQKTSTKTRAA